MGNWDGWEEVVPNQIPAHDFNKKKILIGVFVEKQENVGPNNSNLYVIENQQNEQVVVWGSSIVDTRLKNIQPGELVGIEYLGDKPSKKRKGSVYHDYKVFHKANSDEAKKEFLDAAEAAQSE